MNTKEDYIRFDKMVQLVAAKFAGKFDRGGKPYVLHLFRVMNGVRNQPVRRWIIALGHDLVEDTDVTFKQLEEMGFTEEEVAGIRALTKFPGSTEYEQLLQVLMNIDACYVKLEDLKDNSDITRLKGLSDKDFLRMQKYHRWYMTIKERVEKFEEEQF